MSPLGKQLHRPFWLVLFLAAALAAAIGTAADRPAKLAPDPDAQTVDMFQGMKNGDLAVKFIPKDSREARLSIENKTQKPLNVKLPESFAGVPVLAQAAGQGQGQQNRQQGVGGGAQGGGQFCIPPEKIESLKVPTVCLEHGKAEPRPTTPYMIEPLESFTQTPGVSEVCQMLGQGKISQRVAQAVAWHLNNNMSWDQLAAKQVRHVGGAVTPYFNLAEIRTAMQASNVALQTAQERKPSSTSPGSAGSSK
ncbi:MAG: hypothetical protein ABSF26_31250 [Thermoguttaceae bacterium]|jgi:hypothetical protein